jgi:hypothetical protein
MKGVQKRMGDLSSLAKLIIAVGVFLVLGGGLLLLLGKMGIPLGRLPGDISYHKGNFFVLFPACNLFGSESGADHHVEFTAEALSWSNKMILGL